MKLGQVQISGRAVLAPLAGISDSSFRLLCKRYGAAILFSEMVSADGLIRKNQKTAGYLKFYEQERPFGIQLFGSDPMTLAEATKIVADYSPDFIDINFGCPVKKVVNRNAGAALLKDARMIASITTAVVHATKIPVMAKIRSGWDKSTENAIGVARILEDCGVCAVTIHPRTQTQLFKGHSDWSIIKQVQENLTIPVIGNGDIKNPEDAKKMLDETGCDLVMVGRAAFGNPWIFREINEYLNSGSLNSPISLNDRLNICLEHLDVSVREKGEHRGVREMRKHLAWYIRNLPNSSTFRATLVELTEVNQVKEALVQFFNSVKQIKDIDHDRIVL